MKERIEEIWEEHSVGVAILLIIGFFVFALACAFGVMCLKAWVVMLLWNWVAVGVFGAPVLKFWVAFGLSWLCSLLFKSGAKMINKSED
ncbi:MAG: hypothetical protein IJZ62_04060 [Clostridia bacterium]|nr:hypothetical protein [Clostridia bacterium]